jgi:Ca2+-transporting ATPase
VTTPLEPRNPSDLAGAYRLSIDAVTRAAGTDTERGLTDAEARARLQQDGPNELAAEAPIPGWQRFLRQFKDVLVILLLIATVISAALWLYEADTELPYEAIAIFAVLMLNAVMGYLQESRAEEAVAALQKMSAADATVIRDGRRRSIAGAELVSGDIIFIEEGDTIPADARVLESAALQTAEAALTGESLPVTKDSTTVPDEEVLGAR